MYQIGLYRNYINNCFFNEVKNTNAKKYISTYLMTSFARISDGRRRIYGRK